MPCTASQWKSTPFSRHSLLISAMIFAKNEADYDDWNRRSQSFAARLDTLGPPAARELDQVLARENELRNRDAWALGLGVLGGLLSATSAALWLSLPKAEPPRVSLQFGPNPWLGYSSSF